MRRLLPTTLVLSLVVTPLAFAASPEKVAGLSRSFTRAELGYLTPSKSRSSHSDAAARIYMLDHVSRLGASGAEDFEIRTDDVDRLGTRTLHFRQTINGLSVHGVSMVLNAAADGRVRYVRGEFVADRGLGTRAEIDGWATMDRAARAVSLDSPTFDGEPTLAYAIDAYGQAFLAWTAVVSWTDRMGPHHDRFFVDARTGEHKMTHALLHTAKDIATYDANGAAYFAASMPGTLICTEGQNNCGDSAAQDAHDGAHIVYDYYSTKFGRDSLNGSGMQLVSSVHVTDGSGPGWNNAAWYNNQMVYGDGDGTNFSPLSGDLDVVAHELTHGVTDFTSDLVYANESGALNEGLSDIFGASAEAWDEGGINSTTWLLGEDIYTPGTPGDALRYMDNPTADGYSTDYYPTRLYPGACTPTNQNDQCGVHGNSGIANLAYVLLVEGGTHPRGVTSVNVTGVGLASAEQIFYRAQTACLTSGSNFEAIRDCTAQAATDLYGSAETDSVHEAWDAVGVPGGPPQTGPGIATYDSSLGAPSCATVGDSCDSSTLLDGRGNLGPEPNQPNTLDGCTDGGSGSYHSDESNDRIVVATTDGSDFAAGKTVQIDATVWAWNTGSADTLDLYYAADANSPSWSYITSLSPLGGGAQTLSATYTLPSGSLQAVRAVFRYQGSATSCSGGSYDDNDDLAFAVGGGGGNQDPTVTINSPSNGSSHTQGTSVSFSGTATDPEDGTISSSISWSSSQDGAIGSGASFSTSSLSVGSHTITASVTDSGGANDSDQIPITINNTAPSVSINSPSSGSSFDQGNSVSFSGIATDAQDGTISSGISWTSNQDGAIGSGASFSTSSLSLGAHTITASVTDSGGLSDSDQITVTINPVVGGCSDCVDWNVTGTVSYSNQDAAANFTVESSDTILLEDNTWRRTTQTYNITANTVVEFEFQSTSQGEIHGLGFDEDDSLSSNRIFKVHGSQGWGISDFDNYSGSSFVTYTIPVGQYFTGSAMYLVLVNDYDAGSGNNSRFRNVRIYEDTGGGSCQTLDFDSETLTAYSNQDNTGTVNAEDAGATLFMEGNRWRRTTRTFDVGASTQVCFDFRSTSQGEIHGLGFDEDDTLSNNPRIFNLYGTQNWSSDIDTYDGQYTTLGSWVSYCIPVGTHYTNSAMYLVFVNDKDSGSGTNTSRFRDVEICN